MGLTPLPLSRVTLPGLALVLMSGAIAASDQPAATVVPSELFTVPEGFEVTLWAQSPMLRNPTNIDIDARGRIWVTEGVNYRTHGEREPKGDRVVVLEDTDHDGRADVSRVFVQEAGWTAPLGIAVIDNQVVVSHAPDLILYTDVDRDGVFNSGTDTREVLLTGFNGKNNDHSLHSVTVGPDGLWYFNQGNMGALFTDKSNRTFRVGSLYNPREQIFPWKPSEIAGKTSDDGHVYVGGFAVRMRPNGSHAEIIGHNFRNSYEQTVSSFGDVFQNDNDDPPACRTTFLLEYGNAGYVSLDGSRTWMADRRPGQDVPTAHWRQDDPQTMPPGDVYGGGSPTGIVIHEGDELGVEYRGLLLSGEAARNTVLGYLPRPEGAGFKLERFDFFTTNRERKFSGVDFVSAEQSVSREEKFQFRPSDVAVGPDGAIYVADWFDPRIGANQDLDDSTSGAIYRIARKGMSTVPPVFDFETVKGQIAALKSPAVNVRAVAYQRLLKEGAASIKPVAQLLRDRNPFVRARAVWLLAALGGEGTGIVTGLLTNVDPQVRIVAFRALRRVSHPDLLRIASDLAKDPVPAVRREVAVALRDVPFAQSGDILLELARRYDGTDRTYLAAWGIGATHKEAELFTALRQGQQEADASRWSPAFAQLVWKLTPKEATPDFTRRANAENLSEGERLASVTALGFTPTQEAVYGLLDLAQHGAGRVKEHALWWLLNYKDSRWKQWGINQELKTRGLYDPDAVSFTAATLPAATPTRFPPLEELLALKGDAARGKERGQTCLSCHRVGETGIEYGPTLTGFARRQPPEVVINSIVKPSSDISHGFEGTELKLKSGAIIQGILVSSGDPLIIRSMGGLSQMVPANQVETRRHLERSPMLSAEELGLTPQDVADIAAWLATQ